MRPQLFRAALLFSLLAACHVDDLKTDAYACASDADCGSDWRCVERVCVWSGLVSDAGSAPNVCATRCGLERKLCCGAACVDPATDRDNCGACGTACRQGESCLGGKCLRETKQGACRNGLDDDGDGLVDCQDTLDCTNGTACATGSCCKGACKREDSDDLCGNLQDDDCNGHIDCDDDGCEGHSCALGGVCADHRCQSGCFVSGHLFASGQQRPDSPCWKCDPVHSISGWTPLARGTQVTGCNGLRACDGAGACRRAALQPCAGPGDCASHACQEGLCRQ